MKKSFSKLLFALAFVPFAVSPSAMAQSQPDQNGYAYYYENVGEGKWEKVGVQLQNLGKKTYYELNYEFEDEYIPTKNFLDEQPWFGDESIAQQLAIYQSNFQCERSDQGSCEDQIGGYYGDFIFNADGDHWSSSVSQTTLENGVVVGVPEKRSGRDSSGNPVTYRYATISVDGTETREPVALIGPEGVVRYTSQIQSGEVRPVFVGGELRASGSVELNNNFLLLDFATNTINNVGKNIEFSGTLAGPGGMIYAGDGVATLSGTASYEGATVVEAGALSLKASPGTFDVASSSVDVKDGATLQLEAPSSHSAAFSVNSLSLQSGSKLNKVGGWASLFVQKDGLDTQGYVTIDVAVPDGRNPQIENGLHINASAWSGDGTITKEGRGVLTIGCERNSESECSAIGFTGEASYDYAGAINVDQGYLALYRASLPKASIDVSSESVLEVGLVKSRSFPDEGESGTIKIGALSGEGRVIIDTNSDEKDKVELQVGSADVDSTFSGVISGLAAPGGSADFAKVGSGTLTLAGVNTYEGKTTIRDGVLALANGSGIPQTSPALVTGSGRLDLASNLIGRGEFRIDQLTVADGGQLFVRASQPLVSKNIVLNANAAGSANPGGIAVALKSKNEPPIRVTETFDYRSGSLVVFAPESDSPEGTWKIIHGDVDNVVELSKNTYLKVVGSVGDLNFGGDRYEFEGIGRDHLVFGKKMVNYQGFLKDGSLNLVIEKRDIDLDDPKNPPDCEGLLCDSLPGSEIGGEIISEILNPGFIDGGLDLPIMGWDDIANLVFSGLSPRNVDGPGRGLATYSNLLSDTVFERLPLRQFTPVEVQEAVVEQEQVIEAVPEQVPVRGLWSKSGEVSDVVAQQALDQAIAQADGADADQPLVLASETVAFEQDGVSYVENPSLTAQYAERNGVRGWFRAFGGNSGASRSDFFYNDYAVNAGGGVVGVDVSVAPQVQIGAFANYGTINLWQNDSGTGGGSWNPDGWGGGITADYWTNNFYVQGLFAATGFNGSQRRGIVEITDKLGGESASGDKSATSYTYAVRLGAPFETGRWLLEPQFTATWSQNQEHGFSESGAGDLNLRYRDRSTLYLQTELGMKFTLPINSGDRGLWVPSLKLAWLGDWNQNNADQTIGYAFTNKTVGVPSNQEDVNGALVEVGLDYTIANLNSTSWKLYVKGGAEIWGGDRGTDWRGSGGVTFQF